MGCGCLRLCVCVCVCHSIACMDGPWPTPHLDKSAAPGPACIRYGKVGRFHERDVHRHVYS